MLAVEMRLGGQSEALWTPPSAPSQEDDFLILCLAPFAFVLTTKEASDLGMDISRWSEWSVTRRPTKSELALSLPTADQSQGGIRAMIYPADYVVR